MTTPVKIELIGKCFVLLGFEDKELSDYHTTILMFDEKHCEEISQDIENYSKYLTKNKTITFNQVDYFGQNKEFRVLKTQDDVFHDLRKIFDDKGFNASQFKIYNPHVTCPDDIFIGKVNKIVISKYPNYQIVKSWDI